MNIKNAHRTTRLAFQKRRDDATASDIPMYIPTCLALAFFAVAASLRVFLFRFCVHIYIQRLLQCAERDTAQAVGGPHNRNLTGAVSYPGETEPPSNHRLCSASNSAASTSQSVRECVCARARVSPSNSPPPGVCARTDSRLRVSDSARPVERAAHRAQARAGVHHVASLTTRCPVSKRLPLERLNNEWTPWWDRR